jgi:hypothetical protein
LIGPLEQIKKEASEIIEKISSNADAGENQGSMQEERSKKER